jgi:hypothetical protein
MAQGVVTIGPEFFKKAFADYSNRYWAFVREMLQNSVDAGSTQIDIKLLRIGTDTFVSVDDNGCGMTEEVLFGKLLSLGSSGKDFRDGATGGFGKAKEILYFAHTKYTIAISGMKVTGSGANYESMGAPTRRGVLSEVIWDGDVERNLQQAFESYCSMANFKTRISLNSKVLTCKFTGGQYRRNLDDIGRVYSSKMGQGTLVVRVNGMPMFYQTLAYKGNVVVELDSSKILTSNRDYLVWPKGNQLSAFVQSLTTNHKKALVQRKTEYLRYGGPEAQAIAKPREIDVAAILGETPQNAVGQWHAGLIEQVLKAQVAGFLTDRAPADDTTTTAGNSSAPCRFVIKNTTGLQIPTYYQPHRPEFGGYARSLVRIWHHLMLELHQMLAVTDPFSLGFVFDEDSEAEYEQSSAYGRTFYLNPAVIVQQKDSSSRSMKKRFKLTEKYRIISIAVHEFVHGLGLIDHDEAYANRLTDVNALVMANLKQFMKCFI